MKALNEKVNSYLAIVLVLAVALLAAMLIFVSASHRTIQIGSGIIIIEER